MNHEPSIVLVVDDNPQNRDLLERRLIRYGCRVVLAENGLQALAVARAQPLDLVLLDIVMPGMDGFTVLEQLKRDETTRHIPVIVISAEGDQESIVRCISLGAEDYLPKPFNPVLLRARVGACLEKKRLRDQEQASFAAVQAANLAKTEFISFVAHELKSPLTSIKGYADLIAAGVAGPINEAQASYLGTINANVERMRVLVTDLADISRIEAGQMHLELRPVSLAGLAEEVAQLLRAELDAKGQTLQLQVSDDLPPIIADRMRLSQILTNLLSNAHKYSREGGDIVISAGHVPHDSPDDWPPGMVQVFVRDSGLGIKPEDQARIFERFFRSSDRGIRDVPGTGLGLNITRHLVELQGGRIWFESVFRQGTTFYFTLPVAPGYAYS